MRRSQLCKAGAIALAGLGLFAYQPAWAQNGTTVVGPGVPNPQPPAPQPPAPGGPGRPGTTVVGPGVPVTPTPPAPGGGGRPGGNPGGGTTVVGTAPPIPGVDRPPPGFQQGNSPGVLVGPPGSYGNGNMGLPNQTHGQCVVVSISEFRPPNPGETPTHYADYLRRTVWGVWDRNCGARPANTTLHEGCVITLDPASGNYRVVAMTCAPVPTDAHRIFAGTQVAPGTPVAPPTGAGGYHQPGSFFNPEWGNGQIGGCGVTARSCMGQPITFPQGVPDGVRPLGGGPRPGGPGGPTGGSTGGRPGGAAPGGGVAPGTPPVRPGGGAAPGTTPPPGAVAPGPPPRPR